MTNLRWFALTVWLFVLFVYYPTGCKSLPEAEYRFFQVKGQLFVTNGHSYWHVERSSKVMMAQDGGNGTNGTEGIQFHLQGPYRLLVPNSSEINFTSGNLKFVIMVKLNHRCTAMFLVDDKLNYEGWRIRLRVEHEDNDNRNKAPFVLAEMSESASCDTDIPAAGNLRFFEFLDFIFAANQTLTSVLCTDYNNAIYFVGTDRYLMINIIKSQNNAFMEKKKLNVSLPSDQIMSHYKKSYVIRQNAKGAEVCKFMSLKEMQIGVNCLPLRFNFSRMLARNHLDELPNYNYNHQETTAAKGASAVLITVLAVVGAVILLFVIYVLATKFLCDDWVPTIPVSGLNSKYVGKLQSTSSIKTLKSDKDEVHGKVAAAGKAR